MSRDNRDYVCDLIKRTENKLGIDFYVDWVAYNPLTVFWDSASFCVSDENGAIIFIPRRTKERSYLREVTFHELAHAYVQWFKIPKYISKVFGDFEDMSYLRYQHRIIKHYSGERRIGFVSRYAEVSPEEDFAETFSYVINGRASFNGYRVNCENDRLLNRKINAVKRLLRIS